jgi:hypothetical protein
MGVLKYFDLNKYNADILIETGTGIGNGLADSLHYNLKHYHSCEIEPSLYERNKERFASNENVSLYCSDSLTFLENLLPTIPKETKIIFWLDAHFPGGDYITGIFSSEDNDVNMPLTREMAIIDKYRFDSDDVFLIDDLRLLVPYGNQKQILENCHNLYINYPGLDFLNPRKDTHNINLFYDNEGYVEVYRK